MLFRKTPILLGTLWMMLAAVTMCGQQQLGTDAGPVAGESYSRETILQSQRWRRLRRQFDEWLSVQKIYTPAQVAELTTALERHVASMSTSKLEDFIDDTEDRLAVLMSNEAMDARSYLSFYSDEGRQRRFAEGGGIPDVFGITVAQLRQIIEPSERVLRGLVERGDRRERSTVTQGVEGVAEYLETLNQTGRVAQQPVLDAGVEGDR